jgi:hypothetical protein
MTGVLARSRFLILVKTYPNPSRSLQEVVCTAAMREDGALVRLYPIPFRSIPEAQRFKKWQWIEADVRKSRVDTRPDSYKVDVQTLRCLDWMPAGEGWRNRWRTIKHLVSPSLEHLEQRQSKEGWSLGLIKPANLVDFKIEPAEHTEWTITERQKLLGAEGAQTLFGPSREVDLLEKIPLKFSYVFNCKTPCTGPHTRMLEDWEIGQSWRKWRHEYSKDVLLAKLRERYFDRPAATQNLFLFLGTLAQYPKTWIAIGQIQPPLNVVHGDLELF